MVKNKLPKLPRKLQSKLDKTRTTRGADDSQIYQNRVARNNTVLIPYRELKKNKSIADDVFKNIFENGYIVLIDPDDYFNEEEKVIMRKTYKLILGDNALIFFRTRNEWKRYHDKLKAFKPATNRQTIAERNLGGEYVARVPAITTPGEKGEKIYYGYTGKGPKKYKGAGIRLYEYSTKENSKKCEEQLEAIFWHCKDVNDVMKKAGMTDNDIEVRKKYAIEKAEAQGLLNYSQLIDKRIMNQQHVTICPLCLEELSAQGFITNLLIPEGREVPDLTVTENNLFHINAVTYGEYNHKPYNLGWGHHYCNVVARDVSIHDTLEWMQRVLDKNREFTNMQK